jgi:hypothetical protein
MNEERSAAVSNVLREVGAGNACLEKAANSKYKANTPKICHVKKFIARWPGGSQNGTCWEIKGLIDGYSGVHNK